MPKFIHEALYTKTIFRVNTVKKGGKNNIFLLSSKFRENRNCFREKKIVVKRPCERNTTTLQKCCDVIKMIWFTQKTLTVFLLK